MDRSNHFAVPHLATFATTAAGMNAGTTHGTFSELLQRHAGIVFKVANTYARGAEDRADLAQEIAAQLWRAWPAFDPARSVTTWMYRIALNVAISHVRSNSVRLRHDAVPLDDDLHDIADNNSTNPETEQQLRLLQQFIARQAPLDRALLLLYLEERQQREIAEILGISESNVSTKIGRLKQRIRDEL
jgi:RNA polymerase sigma factor (sigma-70 family)